MAEGVEKRACRRFEIPGSRSQYKKKGVLVLLTGFSEAYPVVNVSKGGLAFECEEKIERGTRLTVRLIAPGEEPLELESEVRWQRRKPTGEAEVGVQFAPFGNHIGWNSLESLDVLRRLEQRFAGTDAEPGAEPA